MRRGIEGLVPGLAALVVAIGPTWAGAEGGWRPIDPSEFALAAPLVERGADAEALFWDVRVEDRSQSGQVETVLHHYLRIKVFTEHGKETQSRVDLPFDRDVQISEIAARTIHPDGSTFALKRSDVFERAIVKGRGVKVRAMSFVMPAVEPGSILEYRWVETRLDHVSMYDRLELQRDIPVQRVSYHIHPLDLSQLQYSMHSRVFNGNVPPFIAEPGGFQMTSMERVPAYHEEPDMPSELQVRPWLLLYYMQGNQPSPETYWREAGKKWYESQESMTRPDGRLAATAVQAIGDAVEPLERLRRLYRFATAVRNAVDPGQGVSDDDLRAMRGRSSPGKTLDRGFGSGWDISLVFAALARAAGFDARIAPLCSHEGVTFDPLLEDIYFLDRFVIAVNVGGSWRFFDPGFSYLPFGALRWQEEGTQALIPDPVSSRFVSTPLTPPEASCQRRIAVVSLDEDGGIQCIGRLVFSGLSAADRREELTGKSPEAQLEQMRGELTRRIAGATTEDLHLDDLENPEQPLVFRFRLRLPAYAQKVGHRLILQPALFQHSTPPEFPERSRQAPIAFHHAWTESDSVVVVLPDSMALDHPEAPASGNLGDFGRYDVSLGLANQGAMIVYRRAFAMKRTDFEVADYAAVREAFDVVRAQDAQPLVLVRHPSP